MIRVLFVCLGNICRSPMAEAVFVHQVIQAGLSDEFTIDSAGTSDLHHGQVAHIGTRDVLRRANIAYDGRSRPLMIADANLFDVILVMDRQNLADVKRLFAQAEPTPEIRLFLQDAFEAGLVDVDEVPDPYYSGLHDEVYRLVEMGNKALLARLRREHGL